MAKEVVLRVQYMTSKDCLFCKLVAGEIKTDPVLVTERVIAVVDINPVARVHVVIIPKVHIESVLTVSGEDANDVMAMFEVAQKIIADKKLSAFRLAFNGGTYQHVPHLHMHLLAGGSVRWSKL